MMRILQRYDLKVKYVPGSELSIADALSRAYLKASNESPIPYLKVNKVRLTFHLPISQERYSEFQQATANDLTLQALTTVVRDGWPRHRQELLLAVREYCLCRDEISEIDGLLLEAQKLIVPQSKKKQMLELIHESHQGIVKCKQLARDILFWPGMSSQIEEKMSQYSLCTQF